MCVCMLACACVHAYVRSELPSARVVVHRGVTHTHPHTGVSRHPRGRRGTPRRRRRTRGRGATAPHPPHPHPPRHPLPHPPAHPPPPPAQSQTGECVGVVLLHPVLCWPTPVSLPHPCLPAYPYLPATLPHPCLSLLASSGVRAAKASKRRRSDSPSASDSRRKVGLCGPGRAMLGTSGLALCQPLSVVSLVTVKVPETVPASLSLPHTLQARPDQQLQPGAVTDTLCVLWQSC